MLRTCASLSLCRNLKSWKYWQETRGPAPKVLPFSSPGRSEKLNISPCPTSIAATRLSESSAILQDRSLSATDHVSSNDGELAGFGDLGERLSNTFAKMELLGQELNRPRDGMPGKQGVSFCFSMLPSSLVADRNLVMQFLRTYLSRMSYLQFKSKKRIYRRGRLNIR